MTQQKGNRTIRQHHEDHATKYREHFAIKACRRDTRFDLASEYTSHSHPIYLPPKNNKHTIFLVQEIFFWSVKKILQSFGQKGQRHISLIIPPLRPSPILLFTVNIRHYPNRYSRCKYILCNYISNIMPNGYVRVTKIPTKAMQ